MSTPILRTLPLGFQWQTLDPFLFCVHHDDAYPPGDARMAPAASLAGRNIGMDFEGKDGWRMYHGDVVPGFPRHPHRGFETITLARRGYIDHSDSLGATARFGHGDVQWMTAGSGVVHCEMFPLVRQDAGNPTELFQIWLNLPAADKMVDPYFTMLWAEQIPQWVFEDAEGLRSTVTVIAGEVDGRRPPAPPPNSWAAKAQAEMAIRTYRMDPGATITLEAASPGLNRMLYYFAGGSLRVAGKKLPARTGLQLRSDVAVTLHNGEQESELLLLQARPLNEPVAHHGPFVMNTRQELVQAFEDYRRTQFGGWPWAKDDPVHPRNKGRFAVHADGREESPLS
ncbi:MAG: pirin family protein [Alphaproteobacteria bacterium]|nr:pirin family protein [Alphaproteobacteria bacterium]